MNVSAFKGFLITVVLVVILVPLALNLLGAVDTSGWDATLVLIWDILPIVIGIVVLVGFLGFIGRKAGAFAFAPVPIMGTEFLIAAASGVVLYLIAKRLYGYTHRKLSSGA